MKTLSGTVKRLMHDKAYGFIAAEAVTSTTSFTSPLADRVLFRELREGQAVTFEKGQGPKGPVPRTSS